jgi:hypothetical protein
LLASSLVDGVVEDSVLVDGAVEVVEDSELVEGEVVEDSVLVGEALDAPLETEETFAAVLVLLVSAGSCPEASCT